MFSLLELTSGECEPNDV